VEACQNATPTANCAAADDFFDTALALDLKTGQIKWAKRLQGFDTWNLRAFSDRDKPELSRFLPAKDFDLGGAGPNLVGNIVGFGQKSGIYWALNPDNGNIVWSTPVGPGSSLAASSGVRQPTVSGFMSLSGIVTICPTHWYLKDDK